MRRACTKSYVTSELYARASQIWCQNVRETRKNIIIKCCGESFARCRQIVQNVEGEAMIPSLIRVKHSRIVLSLTSTITAALLWPMTPIKPCAVTLPWSLVALLHPSFWACSLSHTSAWKGKHNVQHLNSYINDDKWNYEKQLIFHCKILNNKCTSVYFFCLFIHIFFIWFKYPLVKK